MPNLSHLSSAAQEKHTPAGSPPAWRAFVWGALCLYSLLGISAQAQTTVFWDINSTTAGAGGATPTGTWSTSAATNWNTASDGTGATANWTDTNHAVFSAGSDATGTYTVTLGSAISVGNLTVEEGSVTVTHATNVLTLVGAGGSTLDIATGTSLAINSVLDGSVALHKSGTGTLILGGSTANTHSGAVNVNAGTLQIAKSTANTAIGDSAVVTIASGATLAFNGGVAETVGFLSGAGTVNNSHATAMTLTVGGATDSNTFSGVIQDTGGALSLAKSGSGTQILSGANTYEGTTSITAGTLIAANNTALGTTAGGVVVASGATLALQGGIAIGTEAFTLNGTGVSNSGALRSISGNNTHSGTISLATGSEIQVDADKLTLGGVISGANTLTKDGAGELVLTGANTLSGGLVLNGGTTTLVATGDSINFILPNNSLITVNAGATIAYTGVNSTNFRANAVDVVLNDGTFLWAGTGTNVTAWIRNLTMTGNSALTSIVGAGTFQPAPNPGNISLHGNITVNGSGTSVINLEDALNLGSDAPNHTITVTDSAGILNISTKVLNDDMSPGTASNIIKAGAGTLTLSGANTYTGTTTINAGTLLATSNTALGTTAGGVVVASGATLALQGGIAIGTEAFTLNGTGVSSNGALRSISGNNTHSGTISLATGSEIQVDADKLTLGGVISGANTLTKDGAGELVLTGANTLSGGLVLNGGTTTLVATGDSINFILPNNSLITVNAGATIAYTGVNSTNFRANAVDVVLNDGTFLWAGTGTNVTAWIRNLTMTGNSALTSIVGAGTFQPAPNPGNISLHGNITVNGSGTSVINLEDALNLGSDAPNHTITVTDSAGILNISTKVLNDDMSPGTASNIIKAGAGTLTLSGANTYTGTTTINAGTLLVTNTTGSGTGSGAVTVSTGATLGGTGTISGTVTASAANAHLAPGLAGAAGTLGTGALTLGNTTQLDFHLGATNDLINVTGALTLDGLLNVTDTGSFNSNTTYRLLNYTGALTNGTLNLGTGFSLGNDYTVSIATANQVNLIVAVTGAAFWDGINLTADNTAPGGGTSTWDTTSTNWTNSGGTFNGAWVDNLTPTFAGTAGTVTLTSPTAVTVNGMTFNTTGYTLSGTGSITLGSTTPVTVTTGTATVATTLSGSSGLAKSGAGTLILSGTNNITGGTTINAGTLQIGNAGTTGNLGTGDIANNGTLAFNRTDDLTVAGNISGSGALTKAGSTSTVTLSGNNSYAGTTTISAGTLIAASNTALGSTVGGTSVTTNGAILALRDGVTIGAEALTLNGAGASDGALVSVSGNNSFGGAITLGTASTIGSRADTLTLSGGISGAQNLTFTGAGNITETGIIATSTGTLTKSGTGTLILGGANTYSGTTTISAGTLQLGSGGTTGSVAGAIVDNASLVINRSNAFTISAVISGTGTLTHAGTGTTTLTGANTYTGGTTINAGTLLFTTVNGNNLAANSLVTVNTGGTIEIAATNSVPIGTSAIDVTLNGGTYLYSGAGNAGTWVRNLAFTPNGTMTSGVGVGGGGSNVWVGGNVSMTGAGTASITLEDGLRLNLGTRTFDIGTGSTLNAATAIPQDAGAATLVKAGTGTLALAGTVANTFSGGLTVNDGTVTLNKTAGVDATGTGTLTIGDGTGAANSAIVQHLASNQINNAIAVSLNTDGKYDLNGLTETLGSLAGSGSVTLGAGALTAGSLNTSTTFSGVMSGTGSFTKDGTGTTTFSGTAANTFSGTLTVNNGTLALNKTAGLDATGTGLLTIGDGTGAANSAIVQNLASHQINNTIAVTLNADGKYDLNGLTETLGSLAGSGSVALGAGALTAGGLNTSTTFSGVMSGTGSFTKDGTGTTTITGLNTYMGGTTINAGTLVVSNQTGSSTFSIASGATLELNVASGTRNNGSNTTFTGTGTLAKTGAGTMQWELTVATFALDSGSLIDIREGTLDGGFHQGVNAEIWTNNKADLNIAAGARFHGGSTAARVDAITGAGQLTWGFNSATSLTFGVDNGSGVFTGTITGLETSLFIKTGTGTQTFAGASTYVAPTTINQGTLLVTNTTGSATGTGTVTVSTDAILGGTGTISGPVTASAANAHLSPGLPGAAGTLTTGALTLGNTSQLDYDLGTTSDRLQVNSTLTLDGVLNVTSGTGFGANTYRLIDYTGALTDNTLTLGTVPLGYSSYTVSIATANQVNLIVGSFIGDAYWDGANTVANSLVDGGTGTWNTTATNWTTSTGVNHGLWTDDFTPIFQGTAGTATLASPMSVHGMTFNTAGYTLTGSTITLADATGIDTNHAGTAAIGSTLAGTAGLTKTGAGILALSGANTYTGTTTLSAGTLSLGTVANGGANSPLGAASAAPANIVFAGGTLLYTGATATTDRAFTINAGQTATLEVNSASADLVIPGATGPATTGALAKTGAGTLTLSADNTHTGTTTVSAGTLSLGNGGTAGTVAGAIVATGHLVLNRSNALALSTTISGTGNLTQAGTGTTTLTGANTYTGVTTLSAGTLSVGTVANGGSASPLGAAPAAPASIVFAGGKLLYTGPTATTDRAFTINAGQTATLEVNSAAADLVIPGATGPATTGALTKLGAGTLTLSSAQTNTGTTTIGSSGGATGGTLAAGATGALSTGAATVYAGTLNLATHTATIGALALGGGASATTAEVALGTGSVLVLGGTLTYDPANNPAGATISGAGTLSLGANRVIAVGNSTAAAADLTISSTLIGPGLSITKTEAGTLKLTGSNTYTGPTTLSAGLLEINLIASGGATSSIGASSASAANLVFDGGLLRYTGATIAIDRAFTINPGATASLDISDAATLLSLPGATGPATTGALTKLGAGTLALTAANTHTGLTTITAGTLALGTGGTAGSLAGNILNHAALIVNRSDTYAYTATLSGTGTLTKNGTGTLNLQGINPFSGATTINAGTLSFSNGGSAANSPFTVNSSGTLAGTGSIGTLTLNSGGRLSPGLSPGTINATGPSTLNGGSTIDWEINRATGGVAGTNWDLLAIDGTLTLAATSGNPINLNLTTLDLATGNPGAPANVTPGASYSFTFITATGGISGYTGPTQFALTTTGVTGFGQGDWSVGLTGNDLNITFTAVPEPSTYAAIAGAAALALALHRRRRAQLQLNAANANRHALEDRAIAG